MNLKLQIEKELTASIGKDLICPDGETRTLKTFESDKNGVTTLHFNSGNYSEIPDVNFWNEWPGYRLSRDPDAPVSSGEIAHVAMSPKVKEADLQAQSIINTNDVVAMLRDQMQRVRSNSAAIPQAKTMGDLAKQIIEAEKLKLETIKVIHNISNQK